MAAVTEPSRSELLDWQRRGDGERLRAALRRQRWRAAGRLWSRLGGWLGRGVGRVMLAVVYLTLFMPFGVVARLTRGPAGWTCPRQRPGGVAALRLPG